MAIDWNKPIRQKNGRAARLVTTLLAEGSKYVKLVVLTDNNGYESVAYYTEGGTLGLATPSDMDLENIPATAEAQPEIDWTKDVQMSCQERDMWEDFIPLFKNKDHVYGYTVRDGVERALVWHFTNFQFRNKPQGRQAILKMFRSPSFGITMKAYLKNDATTVASVRRWHEDTEGELLDVIEVDLHNIEGLEGQQ